MPNKDKEKQRVNNKKWEDKNREYRKKYRKERNKKNYLENRDLIKSQVKKYRDNNLDKLKNTRMQRVFGISLDQYNAMFEKQKGLCDICMQPEVKVDPRIGKAVKLAVDHNHETGEVRGLLCFACNVGLGKFKDDKSILQSAIKYLEK